MTKNTLSQTSADQPRRKRPMRRVVHALIVLAALVVVLAGVAPMIAASGFGLGKITGAINGRIAGSVQIGEAGFGWFSAQTLSDVKLLDPQGKAVITFDKLHIDATLWSLATGGRDFGRIELTGLRGDIVADESGSNNLLDAVAMREDDNQEDADDEDDKPDEPGKPFQLPGTFELIVSKANLSVTQPGSPAVELTDLSVNVAAPRIGQPVTAQVTGKTRQGDLSGDINANASLAGFDESGALGKPVGKAQVNISGLPVAGIDGMIGQQGALSAVLGPRLDLEITSTTEGGEAASTRIVARSSHLETDLTIDVADVMALTESLTPEALLAKLNLSGSAKLSEVPAAQLDQLLGMEGKLAEAVGDQLFVTLQPKTDPRQGQIVAITITGAHHNSQLTASVRDQTVNVTGTIKQDVQPKFAHLLMAGPPANGKPAKAKLVLDRSVTIDVALQRLSMPLGGFDPAKLAARCRVTVGNGAVTGDDPIGTIGWQDVSATLTTDNLADAVTVALNGTTRHAGQQGQLSVNANLNDLFTAEGKPQFDKLTADGNIALAGLPTPLVDQIAGMDGLLVDALDQRISITADVISNGPNDITANITAKSATLDAKLALHADAKQVTLKEPGTIALQPGAKLLARYLPKEPKMTIASADPSQPMAATLMLQKLVVPRPAAEEEFDLNKVQLAGKAVLRPLKVSGIEAAGDLVTSRTNLAFDGSPSDLQWAVDAAATPAADSLADAAMGKAQLKADGQLTLDPEKGMALPKWNVALAGDRLRANLAGSLDTDMNLALSKQGSATATVTPKLLDKLGMTGEGQPQLTGPAKVTLTFDSLTAALKEFSPAKLKTIGSMQVDSMTLVQADQPGSITLSGLNGSFNVQGPANRLAFKVDGKTIIQQEQSVDGTIHADVDLANWLADGQPDFTAAKGKAKLGVTGLPITLVETFSGMAGKLQPIIGPTLAATVNADLSGEKNKLGAAALAVKSNRINGTLNLALAQTITLAKPSTFTVALDDAALQALRSLGAAEESEAAPMRLTEPTTVTLAVERLSLPMPAAEKSPDAADADAEPAPAFKLSDLAAKARITSPQLTVNFPDKKFTTRLTNFDASIDSENFEKGLTLQAKSQVARINGGDAEPGQLDVRYQLANPIDPKTGGVNWNGITLSGQAKIDKLPAAFIDAFAASEVPATAIFGPELSVTSTAKVVNGVGPVSLSLRSSNAVADAPLQLNKGTLTLEKDVTARMIVTEELTRAMIDHPLLKQTVRSVEPIKVTIYRSVPMNFTSGTRQVAFAVPLRNAGPTTVTIPRITIEPGKLVVRKAGLIKQLLELPETIGKLARLNLGEAARGLREDEMIAWFTPVDLTLVNGVATYSRMDMLLGDHYQVATWGTLNFGEQPIQAGKHRIGSKQARMILGITERAMRRVYNITAFEDQPDYVDQFVMQGDIDGLSPDTKEMTVRLGALTATGVASKIGGEGVGNTAIDILQKIGKARDALDAATGKDDKVKKRQFDPPPPPRKPFPWPQEVKPEKPKEEEQEKPAEKPAEQPEEDKPEEKPEEKIIKDVLKGILG